MPNATPPSPQDAALRSELQLLSGVLRRLHKAMLDVEVQYFGPVGSALELLQLVTNHPHFAWLQKLSALMAQLDERSDDPEPLDAAGAAAYRKALELLVGPLPAEDADFRLRYNALLHDSPDVAIAHGALRHALERLPKQA